MRQGAYWAAAAIAACIGPLAGCAESTGDPRVTDIEARAGRTFADPSILSFAVTGGDEPVRLNYVFSPDVIETRLRGADGTTVPPGKGIAIPAGGKVRFGTGGPLVELIGANRVARGLEEIELNFVFSDGTELYATAPFITPEGAQSL